jgi:hypothetical protein
LAPSWMPGSRLRVTGFSGDVSPDSLKPVA